MKRTLNSLSIGLAGMAVICLVSFSEADEQIMKEWSGRLVDGSEITYTQLKQICERHDVWLRTGGEEGYRANLEGANLYKVDLREFELTDAVLMNTDLKEANLTNAHLGRALMNNSTLDGAVLNGADLRETHLWSASLKKVNFYDANLKGAYLWGADLESAIYDPKKGLPEVRAIARATNLEQLVYSVEPDALVELREAFKQAGMREQERKVTYAINHNKIILAWSQDRSKKEISRLESIFNYVMFDLTCQFGMSPERLLWTLLLLIAVFTIPYAYALSSKSSANDGIWVVWMPDRVRLDLGGPEPVRLFLTRSRILLYAFYFSILSAFSIGWRELNVGNWIVRLQPKEYTLRATGWVRVISGTQSLISVYLLALWVLTYFGRPFD